ncbi:MAG: aminopeptidase P N-terminal domain-containing protein, partial [Candidatus Delongbacteria bacterium]|nr:aminopeptidase P N-terminal domain-containing protein [Candidatus Delongbacteria bacterium]
MLKELKFPRKFFSNNRKKLTEQLEDRTITFILSSLDKIKNRDTFYKFKQDGNYFYLTGLELKRSVLAIYKLDGKVYEVLFRKVLDPTLERWVGKNIPVEYIEEVSGIKDIRNLNDMEDFYRQIFNNIGIEKVYMYNEYITELVVPTYTQVFASNLRKKFNFVSISAINPHIDKLRALKQECEVKMLQRAIDITAFGLADLLINIKSGISENECEG